MKKILNKFVHISLVILTIFFSTSCNAKTSEIITLDNLPEFESDPYVILYDNQPNFSEEELTTNSFEIYSDFDSLNRCGVAYACIGQDIMPSEEREEIGQVKPSGWHTVKYDRVNGKYLYNRCHLIGFQLAGENANKQNLITGTRFLNVEGMLPFENMVADYVKETNHHVMYRVTPIYTGTNLVANGVQMEAYSVEDKGEGICFHVYCYNTQPGIEIDYATGDSWESGSQKENDSEDTTYILNINNQKFHLPDCPSVDKIKSENKQTYTGSRSDLIANGYTPCGSCKP